MSQTIAVILGPTASGKSDLSLSIAQRLNGEVIGADAYQIYRGLDIGTAKLPPTKRRGIRHHLIDVVDPWHEVTVADFQAWARAAIADCHRRGVLPVLCGGSSLYLRAVVDDFVFPGTNTQVRQRWNRELDARGPGALHDVLAKCDPEAAAHILPSNGRRIVRALEVGEITNKPFRSQLPGFRSVYENVRSIGIDINRTELDSSIQRRTYRMWDRGWPEEAKDLRLQGFESWHTASRALGYRDVLAYLSGQMSCQKAIEVIAQATNKFARKQQRMFNQDPRIHWLSHGSSHLVADALDIITR